MKLRTIKRHVVEGFKNIFRNGWMTVASIGAVTITLILVGAFLALILNLNQMAKNIEDDVEVNTLIDPFASEENITALREDIKNIPEVDSVTFSSKDNELNKLIEDMGDSGSSWGMFEQDNPLKHVYIVKAKNPQDTAEIAVKIEGFDHVYEVIYGKDLVNRLFEFNKYARTIGLVLIIGLVLSAIFLISNTIKITIIARSSEIGIMKLVGATNGFIRWPFFIEGMLLGIFGAFIPITAIVTGYYFIEQSVSGQVAFNFVELLPFHPFAWQISLVILIIGIFIGMWGSVMSIRKFLKV